VGRRGGLLGVHWSTQKNTWKAEIKTHGKKRHLGFFGDKHEAHQAYLKAKREIHAGCTI
jgi:hypothetical protein